MSSVQLALNVTDTDIDDAVVFHSRPFAMEPAKGRSGFANFAIADPRLELSLVKTDLEGGHGTKGAPHHYGVEEDSSERVLSAGALLAGENYCRP